MKKFWRLIFVFGVLLALGGCSSVRKMTYIINRSERTGGTLYTCYSAESMDEKPEYVLLRGDVSEPYLKKTPTTDEDLVKDMKSSLALDSRDIILDLNNSYKPTNGRKHLYLACFRPYFFSPNR